MGPNIEFFQSYLTVGLPGGITGRWSDFHGWLYIVSRFDMWAAYI
jgi:hypothetical protein